MTEYKEGYNYKDCPKCFGKGVIPERQPNDEKDYPILIRCPECKKNEL